ncbi:unnamed protein product [Nezara viridula]|uniref:Neuropeptide n=1 Tax=Nezara viridula TaxID=85310 RepID=A0A9P0HGL5_NEZVI|nr:unnamed protein product [Nezara viridula]
MPKMLSVPMVSHHVVIECLLCVTSDLGFAQDIEMKQRGQGMEIAFEEGVISCSNHCLPVMTSSPRAFPSGRFYISAGDIGSYSQLGLEIIKRPVTVSI